MISRRRFLVSVGALAGAPILARALSTGSVSSTAIAGYVFDHCAIDPKRVAIGGFSDGATYAVSLGVINGTLFTHVLAFSPGFIIPGERRGRPSVFISHGVQDDILPIDRCGRAIARDLEAAGYPVTLREFAGGHQMPEPMIPLATSFAGWKTS